MRGAAAAHNGGRAGGGTGLISVSQKAVNNAIRRRKRGRRGGPTIISYEAIGAIGSTPQGAKALRNFVNAFLQIGTSPKPQRTRRRATSTACRLLCQARPTTATRMGTLRAAWPALRWWEATTVTMTPVAL